MYYYYYHCYNDNNNNTKRFSFLFFSLKKINLHFLIQKYDVDLKYNAPAKNKCNLMVNIRRLISNSCSSLTGSNRYGMMILECKIICLLTIIWDTILPSFMCIPPSGYCLEHMKLASRDQIPSVAVAFIFLKVNLRKVRIDFHSLSTIV